MAYRTVYIADGRELFLDSFQLQLATAEKNCLQRMRDLFALCKLHYSYVYPSCIQRWLVGVYRLSSAACRERSRQTIEPPADF